MKSSFAIRHRASGKSPDHATHRHHEGDEQWAAIGRSPVGQIAIVPATENERPAEQRFLHFLGQYAMRRNMSDVPSRVVIVVPAKPLMRSTSPA
jgi:hypothetical protein